MTSLRVASLFSGVGTFDYGFSLAGWESVYLCEWDEKARQVLSARFPGVPLTNDVTEANGADLPDCNCIMFGSPCQDLSVAGNGAGMTEGSGTRSSLFFEAVRIIREKREASNHEFPRFALWENVPGAFSSNAGRDFAAVLSVMVGAAVHVPAGGWTSAGVVFGPLGQAAWRVLDSQFFGVPQRRRRIFLVTDFGGESAGEILFESEGVRGDSPPSRKAGEGITGCLTGGAASSSAGNPDDNRAQAGFVIPVSDVARCQTTRNERYDAETENLMPVFATASGIANALTTQQNGQGTGLGSPRGDGTDNLVVAPVLAFDHSISGSMHMSVSEDVSPTLLAGSLEEGGRGRVAVAVPPVLAFDTTQITSGINGSNPQYGDPCHPLAATAHAPAIAFSAVQEGGAQGGAVTPPLVASDGGNVNPCVLTPYAVRRLTPVECECLQGMPDSWTDVDGMADSHRYRFMGNGGTSFVLKWIAERIKTVLTQVST